MRAITISREYGSGGGEIAARLAQRLGWQLVDHEVVVKVAQKLGISEAEAEAYDERGDSLTERLLKNMTLFEPAALVGTPLPMLTDPSVYHQALHRIIEEATATGHVVIVGRGAQVILANSRDVLHVRIVAPLGLRIAYVMRREGLDQAAALARIQLKDRARIRYLQTEYHQHPQDPHLYDLVVNTDILALEDAVGLIYRALEYKAKRLPTATGELGPVAGLAPYTSRPEDFRPPESMTESSK
jgi:cytidylate kinase